MTEFDQILRDMDQCFMNEQAALLRECRAALDVLLSKKPMLAGMVCGSTTLGNLRAMLHEHRPQAIFHGNVPADDPHPPTRHCGCDACAPSFEPTPSRSEP